MVLLSFPIAVLQYRYVEAFFRRFSLQKPSKVLVPLGLSTLGLVVLASPSALALIRGDTEHRESLTAFRKNNNGLHWKCSRGIEFFKTDLCRTSEEPHTAVWGDSFAMHLVPGLVENEMIGNSLIQITRSNCNPIPNLGEARFGPARAQACIAFNAEASRYIAASETIETVVIGSPFGYFYGGRQPYFIGEEIRDRDPQLAIDSMVETIRLFEESGKRIIIFAPPPVADFDIGECLERKYLGAVTLGRSGCDIDISQKRGRKQSVSNALRYIEEVTDARVIWLAEQLCDDNVCRTEIDSVPIYRDRMHLSVPGSKVLIGNMQLK
jgi:hypothetical protein